jgi:hypothetical protein
MSVMEDTVVELRERQVAESRETPPQAAHYKTKLLEEFTDVECIGTAGWIAWTCPY